MVARGEVWWGESPTAGRRPYLVMSRDAAIGVLHSILAVPVTRNSRGIPTELTLGREDGMPTDCVAPFDNLQPVAKSGLTERICVLSAVKLAEACAALEAAVDC